MTRCADNALVLLNLEAVGRSRSSGRRRKPHVRIASRGQVVSLRVGWLRRITPEALSA
jgi:hypothetical protein